MLETCHFSCELHVSSVKAILKRSNVVTDIQIIKWRGLKDFYLTPRLNGRARQLVQIKSQGSMNVYGARNVEMNEETDAKVASAQDGGKGNFFHEARQELWHGFHSSERTFSLTGMPILNWMSAPAHYRAFTFVGEQIFSVFGHKRLFVLPPAASSLVLRTLPSNLSHIKITRWGVSLQSVHEGCESEGSSFTDPSLVLDAEWNWGSSASSPCKGLTHSGPSAAPMRALVQLRGVVLQSSKRPPL